MRFGAWVLVPLQGAAARCVAGCALEEPWVLAPLRALQSAAAVRFPQKFFCYLGSMLAAA